MKRLWLIIPLFLVACAPTAAPTPHPPTATQAPSTATEVEATPTREQAEPEAGIELLSGTPGPAEIDEAKAYLAIAKASDELNVRTMAENVLRNLEPQLTASAESTQ